MDRDERVAAYVDGELSSQEAIAFENEMATDSHLADAVAQQRRLRDRLAAFYDPVLKAPLPARLEMTASAANDPPRRSWTLPQWGAVAASLALGVIGGRALIPDPDPLGVAPKIARALDHQLAADAGPVRVGITFRTADGRYCRTFVSASDDLAGLACRGSSGWSAQTATVWTPPVRAAYRTAAAETPPAVLAAVDALMAGEPLDAAAERVARNRGWDPQ